MMVTDSTTPAIIPLVTLRTRFAPSPTGALHLGNARTALFAWLYARHHGGQFILRVEDTDAERSKPEYETGLIDDLHWLGLDWDEGPDIGGPHAPYRQTGRRARYDEVAAMLRRGGHAYWCFCGKEKLEALRLETEAAGKIYHYPGFCRELDPAESARRQAAGESAALRLKAPEGAVVFDDLIRGRIETPVEHIADFVLVRNDGMPVYNFAVVCDDHDMAVSHVIRGEDHIANTPKQLLLYRALGWTLPQFAHLPMLLGPDRAKLSKRHGDTSLSGLRERGFIPAAVINGLALCGWSHPEGKEILERAEIIARFDLDRVSKGAAIFDDARLKFLNGQHLRSMSDDALQALFAPAIAAAGLAPQCAESGVTHGYLAALFNALRSQLELVADFTAGAAALAHPGPPPAGAEERAAVPGLRALAAALQGHPGPVPLELYKASCKAAMAAAGLKGKGFYHPLRVALTGRGSGPELDKLVPLYELGDQCGVAIFSGGVRSRLAAALQAWAA
jgi:nondiscriminating glutamyl-tRNA synthetase